MHLAVMFMVDFAAVWVKMSGQFNKQPGLIRVSFYIIV